MKNKVYVLALGLSLFGFAARADINFGRIEHCAALDGFYRCEAGGVDDGRFDRLKFEVDQYIAHTITLKNGHYIFMGHDRPLKLVYLNTTTYKPDGVPRAEVVEAQGAFDVLTRTYCSKAGEFETIYFSIARENPYAVSTLRRMVIRVEKLGEDGKALALRVLQEEGYVGKGANADREYRCVREDE